jgi:TonB-dependent starch-binding outer membrane protein SusC
MKMGYRIRARTALSVIAAAIMLGATTVPLVAQATGTVRGRVVESGTMRPLNGVQVSIPGTNRGALTNAAGDYMIVAVPAGQQTVRAQMIGYRSSEQTVTVVSEQPVQANFELGQSAIALDELVVTGTPGATQRRALGNAVSTRERGRDARSVS